jgi:CHAT domain-containing protein
MSLINDNDFHLIDKKCDHALMFTQLLLLLTVTAADAADAAAAAANDNVLQTGAGAAVISLWEVKDSATCAATADSAAASAR